MKKIKLVLLALLTLTMLVACGSKKETITVCEGELSGIPGAFGTGEYYAVGDNVVGYKTVQNIPYAVFGTDDKELVKTAMEEAAKEFELSDNVNYSYDFTDDTFIATISLKEIKSATDDELQFVGLSISSGSKISLKLSVEHQQSETNMTCTTSDKE